MAVAYQKRRLTVLHQRKMTILWKRQKSLITQQQALSPPKKPTSNDERKVTRLKGSSVNFHPNPKLTLIVAALYAVLSFLLVAIVIIVGNTNLGRLITFNKCSYQYSATLGKSIGQDDYYLFEAGIGFTRSKESNRGINAEVLMQTAESDYTDSVSWNAYKLSTYEIAISADVAREYGLLLPQLIHEFMQHSR